MRKFDSAGRSFAEKLHIPRTTEGWQGAARGFARKALDVLGQRKPAVLKKPAAKDAVDCSVFAPPSAPPGETILVQVFLHVPEQSARAQFMASVMDASTTFKGVQSLEVAVPRGARVTAALSVADAEVDEPQQSVVWRGEPVFAQFLLRLPERAAGSALYPVVRISVGGALVGRISFRISLDAGASRPKSEPRGDSAKRYQHAFLSYAATDRREVLKRAQVLKAAGVGFFQDVLSLDPGDRWQREIYRHIDRCDLFLLFWSKAARDSEWVIREAEYALARQRTGEEPDIVPVILEGPPVILPPESLKELHFNDRINYLIAMS
jgi:hypothetical protein